MAEIGFEPTAFDHPVFVMSSSGATWLPKCMVLGAGGERSVCRLMVASVGPGVVCWCMVCFLEH